ncbi:TetR/AcrR family transcriptional regulator [Embleya sp. AB8]|uniref:TetR/AcrR family transcriptional regulator n=1 Tax=Embleya sp. AB8 TaxID=3156304 RepID=UPI003C70807B
MSPRVYRSDKRQAAAEETRQRVLAAARSLLAGDRPRISVDAVAKAADVSRQTIYNVFGTKSGLLEALFDSLAGRAGLDVTRAFHAPDADTALRRFTEGFCHFWASDPIVIRRLRGMAVLDPDLDHLLHDRDDRRRSALTALLAHHADTADTAAPTTEETVDLICQLTGFETYEGLSRRNPDRDPTEVADLVAGAVIAVYNAGNT